MTEDELKDLAAAQTLGIMEHVHELEALVKEGVDLVTELRGWVEYDSSGLLDRSQSFVERGEAIQ